MFVYCILGKWLCSNGIALHYFSCACVSLKRKRHFDEIFVTGCTENCHSDNFRCIQRRKFRQNGHLSVSILPGDPADPGLPVAPICPGKPADPGLPGRPAVPGLPGRPAAPGLPSRPGGPVDNSQHRVYHIEIIGYHWMTLFTLAVITRTNTPMPYL